MSINIDENITFVYACMGNDQQQECKEKEQISLKGGIFSKIYEPITVVTNK
jgi:hypothetical protein